MIPAALSNFYRKHERWAPIASFFAGFIFDMFMLRRIDELKVILQQAIYLFISGTLITMEILEHSREIQPLKFFQKLWKYREFLLHFLLGTLLNSYTIFYFKSASSFTSFLFIAILVALLIFNEFVRFGKMQTQVHMAFWSLCLISYFVALSPIVLGFIGMIPFLSALATTILVFMLYYLLLKRLLVTKYELLKSHVLVPFLAIQIIFCVLYFAHMIPPVPLSVSYMGVFHNIEKKDGTYELSYTRPAWKFWQHGDQSFSARPGDSIFCFAQIFSPSRFQDQLQVRWLYWDKNRGWQSSDAIPVSVIGGREEGYRARTKKSNFQPGEWRVQIETLNNQVIGRIDFTVESDESTNERIFEKIIF